MSLKVKLVSVIVAFVIIVSLLMVGVYAATNVTLNIGGNVSFTATSVNALISGSVVGTATPLELDDISLSADTTDGAVTMPPSWQNVDLTYGDNGSPITVTITIENRSTDRGIDVTLNDSSSISNVTIIRKCDSSPINASHNGDIGGGETVAYTFELTLNSRNNPANGTFSLSFNLVNDPSAA